MNRVRSNAHTIHSTRAHRNNSSTRTTRKVYRKNRRRSANFRAYNPFQRMLCVLIIAIVVGVTLAFALMNSSRTIGRLTGRYYAQGPAAQALETLSVDDKPTVASEYDRELFGYRTAVTFDDGCDVREHVLARDLTDIQYENAFSCVVKRGTLNDPYTGATIDFVRGASTSGKVQIDHVVSLSDAWQHGASHWDAHKRYEFGNDLYNLLAVDGQANQEKGSASAAYWLPTNSAYRCEYVARQIGVKKTYELSVSSTEKESMQAVLVACPGQELPNE